MRPLLLLPVLLVEVCPFPSALFDPLATLELLLPLLLPSRPFAVYCEHLEPLLRCHRALARAGHVVALSLTSCWYRHFQVLPNRTHPTMEMCACGGYILSGTKVLDKARPADCPISGKPPNIRQRGGGGKGKGRGRGPVPKRQRTQ